MNHLKHIRGINVPFRVSPNAVLPSHYGQHADIHFENRQLKSQLLRSDSLFIGKKSHGVVKYSRQFRQDNLRLVSKESKTICKQRSKTKSSVTSLKKKSSMHKKLSSENKAKRVCHYSTYQNVKFHNDGINKQFMSQNDAINGANINRHSSFIASVEKHPRSYAEMIADYSESLYKESIVGTRSDNFHFNNAIRKSPFSTFSIPSSVKKIVNVAEYSKLSTVARKNEFSLPIKSFDLCRYNDINTIEYYDFQHHNTCTAESMSKSINQNCVTTNDLKSDDQSYAKLVADCSKSMHNIPNTSILNDGLVPKRNVLARNSLESISTPRRASGTYMQETLRKITPTVSTMPFEKNNKGQVTDLKDNWLREMENVMNDLKNVTERKIARVVPKLKESDILQSVDASDNSLNNIHGLTELIKSNKRKAKDTTIKKLNCQSDKIDKMEKSKKDLQLQKHNYLHSSDKIANRPDYFGNAAESSAVRKNSICHMSTSGNTSVLKQPQVKLRMVPSEKESVVSINVDQAPIGSLDPLNSKHLSVVVQSDQKEDQQLKDNQWNAPTLRHTKSALQRSDFGPMHISISENSAPVKQIEFSINGKPVSELKSITARTERLDVMSSVDKIEIRIPFAKDDLNALDKSGESDLSKGVNSNIGQILNVQISANFQNEPTKDNSVEKPAKTIRYHYDKDTIPKSSSPTSPNQFNNFSKAYEETLSSSNIQQYESSKQIDIKFNDTKKNINECKTSDDVDLKIQRETTKNLSAGKTITGISLIKEANNIEVGNLNIKKANITVFTEANKYNKSESSGDRFPSKMIPWWSSSDSFNKMKKKEDNKPLMQSSNRNKQKAVSNLNQNLISESLLTKPKETSNSKILTKKTLLNNATVTTNNSNNIISYSNSMKPYEESKPTLHYACSFRLKSNQENSDIIPEIIRNGLKAEDNQALMAKKDSNKISEIKQTESTLRTTDTINMRGKHDTSVNDKTSVLQRKIKTPSSAQNLSPRRNQEKKNNYSLKQTKSIDDVSKSIKSKIKDILDAIKPIEKREDDTLVNYGLKKKMPSRKSIVKSNSAVKEVQNPSPVITTKDFIPNSSTAEIVSKKIDEIMLTKQTESTNTEQLKTKMDILLKNKDLKTIKTDATIDIKTLNKNDATIDIKTLNKNDVKNIKEIRKNDFMSSSSSNFRNSPALMQTIKKQEQIAGDTIIFQDKTKHNLKSLLEANKNEPSSNIRISSGTMQKSEKSGISGKVSSEVSKQNRPKSLTSIKNTPETIQESEKLRRLTSSKLANLSKEPSDIMIDKSSLQTIKQMQCKSFKNTNMDKITNINKLSSSQTISNSTLKIKNTVYKNLLDKNAREMPIAQSVKNNKTDAGDMIARIITQNPKSKDPLLKECEENFNKSVSGKGYLLDSAGPSRKSNNSVGFKSAGSKKSRVISNNNCTYERKLLMESFYSNFNRKNNIISSSQSTISKVRRNLNVVDMLESESTVIRSDGPWINIDRPEKSILYSAWLQRFENDVKKNRKLF